MITFGIPKTIQKRVLILNVKVHTGIRPGCFSCVQEKLVSPGKNKKIKNKNDKVLKKIIRHNCNMDLNTWPLCMVLFPEFHQ